jgi:hypothetical protein
MPPALIALRAGSCSPPRATRCPPLRTDSIEPATHAPVVVHRRPPALLRRPARAPLAPPGGRRLLRPRATTAHASSTCRTCSAARRPLPMPDCRHGPDVCSSSSTSFGNGHGQWRSVLFCLFVSTWVWKGARQCTSWWFQVDSSELCKPDSVVKLWNFHFVEV